MFKQALEHEIVSHEPLIETVTNTAHHMVEQKHYASDDVSRQLENLQHELQHLKDKSGQRKAKLLDAVESQTVSVLLTPPHRRLLHRNSRPM